MRRCLPPVARHPAQQHTEGCGAFVAQNFLCGSGVFKVSRSEGSRVPANRGLPEGLPSLSACHTPSPPSHSWVSLKACLSNVQSPPSCLGPTQQLSDSQEGGWRCPPRWALAPVSTGKREPPVPHVMGARGLPRPDASAQTFPKLALSSKSWLKNSASRASTASSPPNSNRRALPVTWPHLSTHLQPSITTCKTTGFWLQFIENKGLKCWL